MADQKITNLIVGITTDETKFAKGADEATNALRRQKNAAKDAAKETSLLKGRLKETTNEVKRHTSAFQKLASAVSRIAFYRAIRSALKAVTQAFREGVNNLYQYSTALNSLDAASAKNTMDSFASTALYVKNSLGAALMPILQALVPVVEAVANAFIYAANAVNQFFHAIKGEGMFTKAKKYAVDFADSLGGAGRAAKELKKQVFGFDELNIFSAPSNGGGGGASGLDYSKMFEEAKVNSGLFDFVQKNWLLIKKLLSSSALVLGGILALSGVNIPLGIGLMAAGAAGLLSANGVNWNGLGNTIKDKLAAIATIVGGAMLAMGAILTFSGFNIPVGIALMAAGLTSMVAGSINWDSGSDATKAALTKIETVVGGALLGLGAIFALTGANIPLGVGMMIAGATALASAATINWDFIGNTAKEKMAFIGTVVGGAVLALGAILALTGANLPLGIGLMVAGAVALNAGYANLNDDLRKKIDEKFGKIKQIVTISTLAIAGILIFVNPAIGIPLLIGAMALAATDIDWDGLNKKIKEAWEKVKQTGRDIKKDLLGWWESIKSFFKQIVEFNASVTLTPSMQWKDNTPTAPSNGKYFAEGGTPSTGSYFWAGEAGPELVGQVGSKTTVTSQDQFTAGMEGIMDNTNTVIMQAAQALIQAIQSKPVPSIRIGDRDIVSMYDRGKTLAGGALVE